MPIVCTTSSQPYASFVHLSCLHRSLLHANRTMASTTLSDLAPEIMLNICKYLDSFSSVLSFAAVSNHFHGIWKSNTNAVCGSILPSKIDCYQEANALVQALERVVGFPGRLSAHQQAIFRTKYTFLYREDREVDYAIPFIIYFTPAYAPAQNRDASRKHLLQSYVQTLS